MLRSLVGSEMCIRDRLNEVNKMSNIYTVEQTANEIPALTQAAIRWHLFNREQNGLSKSGAIIKNGRRVLIDLQLYIEWLKSSGGQ